MAERRTYVSDGLFYGAMSFVLASVFAVGIAFAYVELGDNSLVGGFMIAGIVALIGGWVIARWAAGGDLPPPNTVRINPPKAPTVPRSRAAEQRAAAATPQIPGSAHEAGVAVGAAAKSIVEDVKQAATSARQSVAETVAPEETQAPPATERSAAPAAEPSEVPAAAEEDAARKPPSLSGPREGGADDLLALRGIGPKLSETLHELGVYHYDQIAAWTPEEVAWIDQNVEGVSGRASRDDWVGQAKALVEGEAGHS